MSTTTHETEVTVLTDIPAVRIVREFEAPDDAHAFGVAKLEAIAVGAWCALYRGPIQSGLRPIVQVDPRGGIAMRNTTA